MLIQLYILVQLILDLKPQKLNRQLAINNSSGNCLRLIYNNNSGTESNYTDLLVSSSGNLNITPSGGIVYINSTLNTISTVTGGLTLGGISISASGTQINYLEPITTLGVATPSACLTLDSSSNITGIGSIYCSATYIGDYTDTSSGGYLRIVNDYEGIVYIQTGITTTPGSSCDLFIGNIGQITSNSARQIIFKSGGSMGIGTNTPNKQLSINSSTGGCLRLVYNNNSGTESNYTDLLVSSSGNLSLTPSGGTVYINSTLNTTSLKVDYLYSISGSIYCENNLGIYTSTANKALAINDYAGNCMRLIYNNNSGTETNYVDLEVSSSGGFIMAPSGNLAQINGDLVVTTYCTIGSSSLGSYPLYVNGSVSYSVGGSTLYSGSGYAFSTNPEH